MIYASCSGISKDIELVTPFTDRQITHVFHDIDGTHSLIRQWEPVMALVTGYVSTHGNLENSPHKLAKMISKHTAEEFPEAQRFAIESAGLSALTQMEWALRKAAVNGIIELPELNEQTNREIIEKIWNGEEYFEDFNESALFQSSLSELASKLFITYEILLKSMSRDRNLEAAAKRPEDFLVRGSNGFLKFLFESGVKNYFVTGAVIDYDQRGKPKGSMYEEIQALKLDKFCCKLAGSTWDKKNSKFKIMEQLCKKEKISPSQLLIIGDGRSEIAAGTKLGALTISRLDFQAKRPREIHRSLGVNLIIEDYQPQKLKQIFTAI